jgi:hypothetical protein
MSLADLGPALGGYVSESPLLENVAEFVWKRDVNPAKYAAIEPDAWRRTADQLESAHAHFIEGLESDIGYGGYRLARLDIDNDGVLDNVFYQGRATGSTLLVLNADRVSIDVKKTERILKHPTRLQAGWGDVRRPFPDEPDASLVWVGDAYDGTAYLVLSYHGKYYVSFSWVYHPDYSARAWRLRSTSRLYLNEGEHSEELCEFGSLPR